MVDEQTADRIETDLDSESVETTDNAPGGVDLSRVRDLVLAAHPDVVPEMIQGGTFDDLMASVEPAREAYQRIVADTAQSRTAPKVAAQPGQRSTSMVDIEALSPLGKISEGLRRG